MSINSPYSAERMEVVFSEVELQLYGLLGSTYSPGPTPISVPGWDRHSSVIISSLGTFSTRFSELVGVPPSVYRRQSARATAGMAPCVAKQVSRPIRNREAQAPEPHLE